MEEKFEWQSANQSNFFAALEFVTAESSPPTRPELSGAKNDRLSLLIHAEGIREPR